MTGTLGFGKRQLAECRCGKHTPLVGQLINGLASRNRGGVHRAPIVAAGVRIACKEKSICDRTLHRWRKASVSAVGKVRLPNELFFAVGRYRVGASAVSTSRPPTHQSFAGLAKAVSHSSSNSGVRSSTESYRSRMNRFSASRTCPSA